MASTSGEWDLSPPRSVALGDHDVPLDSERLRGRRVALVITGGIAAMKAPSVARALRRHGAEVVAFASEEALRYVTREALEWATTQPVVCGLSPAAEHLSDSRPFHLYLVAPATYNTINKLAQGIADGPVTSTLASALGRLERGTTRLLVAPTMHGTLHNSILTESLRKLRGLGVGLIRPRDDYGKHNLPDSRQLAFEVMRALSSSPLRGVRVVVTGGPTPVPIDGVRRIVNRFRGRLGIAIAEELWARGAEVKLIHGASGVRPPAFVPHVVAETYADYRRLVGEVLAEAPARFGVFSAAVADYEPVSVAEGKIPSGGALSSLALRNTVKVIDEVRERFPSLGLISFKYEERLSREQLLDVARTRLARGHLAVVANLGEETARGAPQQAWLVTPGAEPRALAGKQVIASGLADHLEASLGP